MISTTPPNTARDIDVKKDVQVALMSNNLGDYSHGLFCVYNICLALCPSIQGEYGIIILYRTII